MSTTPEPVTSPVMSTAHVQTDRAERYAKQLGEHLGRKVTMTETPDGRRVEIAGGTCLLSPTATALVLSAQAPDGESLARVQDVVGRHLERFGARDELTVAWRAA